MKKNFPELLLSIFPFLIILLGLLILGSQTFHHLINSDPEYFYLLSGLNIARFDVISGDFHHPGIPMQIYSGIVIGLDFLFGGKYPDIITDVMLRPEHYINAIIGSLIIIIGIVFFVCGLYIYKLTNSIATALFFQVVPFTNQTAFLQLTFLVPENIVLPLFLIIIVLMIRYIQKELSIKEERNLIIFLSIMIALSFLQKLTMLPLVFVPFFIFRGKRNVITYLVSLGVATLILIIPIITHLQEMYNFLSQMSTHSGFYGTGEKEFIDFSTIVPNLTNFYYMHKVAFYSFFIFLAFLPITLLPNKKASTKTTRLKRVIYAFAFAETLMFAMLLKHYKAHYATPIIALSLFNFYLIIEFIRESNLMKKQSVFSLIYYILGFLLFITYYPSIANLMNAWDEKKKYENDVVQFTTQFQNMPKIIFPRYYGTPFIEFSILQGIYNSRNMKLYCEAALKLYPRSYFYTSSRNVYDITYKISKLTEILQKHKNFILSYYDDDEETKSNFFKEIEEAGLSETYEFKTVFYNENSKMVLVEMTNIADTLDRNNLVNAINWDMEKVESKTGNPNYSFENNISNQLALSGKSSLLLSGFSEFGDKIEIDSLQTGDIIQATVWRFRNGNKSGIAVAADSISHFFAFSNNVIEVSDFWDKIELRARVPEKVKDETIQINLWRNDKDSPVYFDDIEISVFRPKPVISEN
ncbi:MAG TPA: hypothetical protein VIN10_05245 [Bacteroidales bacterium]